MNQSTRPELPLLEASSPGGCCGDSCACSTGSTASTAEHTTATAAPVTATATEQQVGQQGSQAFQVTGLTCGHCVAAVTEEVRLLPGVTGVTVELVAGGTSTLRITGTEPLHEALVAAAVEEAGNYQLD